MMLNEQSPADLSTAFGLRPEVARRVFRALHRGEPLEEVQGLPRLARAALGAAARPAITIRERRRSLVDSFTKYLLELPDGELIESVLIPLPAGPDATPEKHVLCVSSQVGCPLDCVFCATGAMGLRRNLAVWEIVEQVAVIAREARAPIRNLVFMGMGEPLLNLPAVLRATDLLSEPCGLAIGRRSMTISTAGVVPGIRELATTPLRLAVSIGGSSQEQRERMMPRASHWTFDQVLDAALQHAVRTGDRVGLEYVMVAGETATEQCARQLAARLDHAPVRLGLIDVNDRSGRFAPPEREAFERFREIVGKAGIPVVRRYSGGRDIDGACGMLASRRGNSESEAG